MAALTALGGACRTPNERSASSAGTETPPTASQPAIEPVVMPDLSRLSPPVQQQVRNGFEQLERTRARDVSPEELGRAYGELGVVLMAADFKSAALTSLLNARQLAENDPPWPYYLGHLYGTIGERANAAESFERVLALQPGDLATMVRLGDTYLDQDRPEAAERLFAQALAREPDSPAALAGLGRACLARGDTSRAVQYLERALAVDPKATALHYPLAMAYRDLGQLGRAEEHLRQRGSGRAALRDPFMREYQQLLQSGEAYYNRGVAALNDGDLQEAAALLQRGLELEPQHPGLGHALGTVLYRMGRVREALAQFDAVLRRAPDRAETHFSAGVILEEQGRHREALDRFAAAIRHRPDYVDAHLGLAEVLQVVGRPEESLPHWRQVVDLNPGFAEAWVEGARALLRLARYEEARDWLAAARKAHPRRTDIARLLADVEASLAGTRGATERR